VLGKGESEPVSWESNRATLRANAKALRANSVRWAGRPGPRKSASRQLDVKRPIRGRVPTFGSNSCQPLSRQGGIYVLSTPAPSWRVFLVWQRRALCF